MDSVERLAKPRKQMDRRQRVAAQVEEVVLYADRRDAQHLLPDQRDRSLKLAMRCGLGAGSAWLLDSQAIYGRGICWNLGDALLDCRPVSRLLLDPVTLALERVGW